jgi:hypothetical protein
VEITVNHARPYDRLKTVSRYLNPPSTILSIGRPILNGEFETLKRQIKDNEVVVAYFHNRNLIQIASHIDGQGRLNQIMEECLKEPDGSYAPAEFYAADKSAVNVYMDSKIP